MEIITPNKSKISTEFDFKLENINIIPLSKSTNLIFAEKGEFEQELYFLKQIPLKCNAGYHLITFNNFEDEKIENEEIGLFGTSNNIKQLVMILNHEYLHAIIFRIHRPTKISSLFKKLGFDFLSVDYEFPNRKMESKLNLKIIQRVETLFLELEKKFNKK